MSVKPRTIDNLGIDSSVRYAKDVESTDIRLLEDSKIVSKRIETPASKPYIPSELDQLFSHKPSVHWALFTAPPEFELHTRPLFSHQLIPSLGSTEKQESGIDKIQALEDTLNRRKKKGPSIPDDREEEEERKTLTNLLKCIENLDRALSFINARRNQYHRG